MQHRRLALLLTTLLILSLVLSACGPRPQQGELAKTSTSDTLVVDLPAIVIDYDAQGKATLSGAPLSTLGAALGQDLSSLERSPEAIKKLTDAGIQNMFVNLTPTGLNMYSNGNPMLTLAWTPQTLGNMGDLLGSMNNPSLAQVKDLIPLLANMSVGIVMRFPTAGGATEAPLVSDKPADPQGVVAAATKAAPAALQSLLPDNMKNMAGLLGGLLAGLPPLTITFDANGAGTLQGLAPFIASQIPPGAIQLPPDTLKQLQDLGIQKLQIKNSPDGITFSVNDKEMPTLLWSRGEFTQLADAGVNAGLLQVLANLDDSTLSTLKTAVNAAPVLQAAKLDVTVVLPQ